MRPYFVALLLFSAMAFASPPPPPPFSVNQAGLTGTWYDPTTSGQGFMIEIIQQPPTRATMIVFGGWFTYDMAGTGEQRWYAFQGPGQTSDTSVELNLYQVSDGYFGVLPPPSVATVGTATLQFSDCDHGEFDYSFDGTGSPHGAIPLTRLTNFYYVGTCGTNNSFFPSVPPTSLEWLSGSWYDPAVSGQGFTFGIDQTVFGGWYTFTPPTHRGDSPNQVWYSLQSSDEMTLDAEGNYVSDDIMIYETSGGGFVSPAAIQTTSVGTATLKATSCSAMTLTYNLTAGTNAGSSATLNLRRPGPVPGNCDYSQLHQ
jgi:hypothetical protein